MHSRLVILVALMPLTACVEFTTYNKVRTFGGGTPGSVATATYIDVKQRAVFTVPRKTMTITTGAGGSRSSTTTDTVICAEPSPDAVAALAATGNASVAVQDKVNAALGFGFAESASAFGLRTQSIQLMRDTMFRLCEGVASGTLTSLQFETMHRRLQSSMVAILAIEQLTGAVRAPTVLLSGTSRNGAPEIVAERTDKVVAARAQSATAAAAAEAAAAAATKAEDERKAYLKSKGKESADDLAEADKAGHTALADKSKAAAADKTKKDAAAATAKATLEDLEKALASALAGGGTATSTATAGPPSQAPLDSTAITAMSDAVENIVSETLGLGFMREVCATHMTAMIEGRSAGGSVVANVSTTVTPAGLRSDTRQVTVADGGVGEMCIRYADQTIQALDTKNQMKRALIKRIADSKSALTKDEMLILAGYPLSVGSDGTVPENSQMAVSFDDFAPTPFSLRIGDLLGRPDRAELPPKN